MVNFLMNYYNIIFLKYQMSHKNVSFKKKFGGFYFEDKFSHFLPGVRSLT